jgi:RsiW-degrading membrane proteinase PrsW (M82 family)
MVLLALFLVLPVVLFYFSVLRAADRFEPEPLWLLVSLFLWGAVVATVTAIIGNVVGQSAVSAALGAKLGDPLVEASTASFVAPLVEETTKGTGLLVLWLLSALWLKELDGPLDGVIYGGVVGLGFTLTEDVLYMMQAASQAGLSGAGTTYFLRTILSGLGHASFTAATGLGIGIAVVRRSPFAKVFFPIAGWMTAVGLHALHNLLCTFLLADGVGFVVKLLVFWCFDFLYFVLLLFLALRDRNIVREQLRVEVGRLLGPKEYERTTSALMLMPFYNFGSLGNSRGGRKAARKKQLDLIELAFIKFRQSLGEQDRALDNKEKALRRRIAEATGRGVHIGAL